LRETIDVAEGGAERPLSRVLLKRKFTDFAHPIIWSAAAARVLGLVNRLQTLSDLNALLAALKRPGKQTF
jgi:2-methylcitrate dehydratase